MNDRALSLLEQYDIEVLRTRKGRGTFICETNQGSLVFQEYNGNRSKLKLQQVLLKRIKELGLVKAEELIPGKEGQLFVKDNDGICYILKTHYEGNECDIYDARECAEAIQLLARLHHCMDGVWPEASWGESESTGPMQEKVDSSQLVLQPYSPLKEYEKHNRELARVWSYLKKKGQKQVFEKTLLGAMEYFISQAREVTESWRQLEADAAQSVEGVTAGESLQPRPTVLCHGDYQYHNILHTREGWRIVNFEKLQADDPVRDVYLFLRKVMEKNNWAVALGKDLMDVYEAVRSLSDYSRQDLYHRFAYPEKFWKITNFYYNSSKAWIPEKNLEKLEKVISQEDAKQKFLHEVFEKHQ